MITRRHPVILLQEYHKLRPRGQNPANRLVQPPYRFDWSGFTAVQIVLRIKQVNGGPTTWSLKPRLRLGISTTAGYQFTNPEFHTLTADEAADMTREGTWFPDLTEATTLPGLWSRTILNPPALMQIDLGESGPDAFTMTGGTDPNLQTALIAYPLGG